MGCTAGVRSGDKQIEHRPDAPDAAPTQDAVKKIVAPPVKLVAQAAKGVSDIKGFTKAVAEGRCTRLAQGGFLGLDTAVRGFCELNTFFQELLPFICDQALEYERLFPLPINIIDDVSVNRTVEWTQRQCLCILCNAFLCAWPGRTSDNCRSIEDPSLPSINFDELFIPDGNFQAQTAKVQMFLHYALKQRQRLDEGDKLSRKLCFVRANKSAPEWCSSTTKLCKITVKPLGESIDAAKDMLRADFANKMVGGGSLAYGCVQEEIMFACHPELNCARLIFTPMLENEAFILCGAEQFAQPSGYAMRLTCAGAYVDPTEVVDGRLRACIAAIDAVDYRGSNPQVEEVDGFLTSVKRDRMQYKEPYVARELLKAYVGFAVPAELNAPHTLATGNWGAGAFLGDASLKALVQWAAASEAGLDIHYFPFDNRQLHDVLPKVVDAIHERNLNVGDLVRVLFSLNASGSVLRQLNARFSLNIDGL